MEFYANHANHTFLGDLVDDIRKRRACERVDAAVAYVDTCGRLFDLARDLRIGLHLRCLCNHEAQPNPVVVDRFLRGPGNWQLRLTRRFFHAKVIWFRGSGAYVGSANLTERAWLDNTEAGIFLPEAELQNSGLAVEIQRMFDHVDRRSRAAVPSDLPAIEALRSKVRSMVNDLDRRRLDIFASAFEHIPGEQMESRMFARARDKNDSRRDTFVKEWAETQTLLRKLQRAVEADRTPLAWVPPGTPGAVELDQMLNWFYEVRIARQDVDVVEMTARLHEQNRAHPDAAFGSVMRDWRRADGVHDFIRATLAEWAPDLRVRLSRERLATLDVAGLAEIMRRSHAIRDHAYRVRNSTLGLAPGVELDGEARLERFATWLWGQPSSGDRYIRDVLLYVLWEDRQEPTLERLWNASMSPTAGWALPHFRVSSLGELLGWARPEEFSPRNNRVSRALHALGFEGVERYGDS